MSGNQNYIKAAIAYALEGMHKRSGGPFGAVIVKGGQIIGMGHNSVTSTNDPTAHAEIMAIREACNTLGSHQLTGCDIYSTCEPCPMCLGAIYWARPDRLYYACSKQDAAEAGFDDAFIYEEISLDQRQRSIPFIEMSKEEALDLFRKWQNNPNKQDY